MSISKCLDDLVKFVEGYEYNTVSRVQIMIILSQVNSAMAEKDSQIAELQARCDRMEADSLRYKFLREPQAHISLKRWDGDHWVHVEMDELDRTVDQYRVALTDPTK
jgi:hypothetical protein